MWQTELSLQSYAYVEGHAPWHFNLLLYSRHLKEAVPVLRREALQGNQHPALKKRNNVKLKALPQNLNELLGLILFHIFFMNSSLLFCSVSCPWLQAQHCPLTRAWCAATNLLSLTSFTTVFTNPVYTMRGKGDRIMCKELNTHAKRRD